MLATFITLVALLTLGGVADAKSRPFRSPDILVLGDSQLSFGGGPVLSDFFKNFAANCASSVSDKAALSKVAQARWGMLGPRSTSIQSWITRGTPAWKQLCRKDKRFGVNASVWGALKTTKRRFIQVGEGRNFQFCGRGATPLQAMFRPGYYRPDIVMFFIGGNGAGRLARSRKAAKQDVSRFIATLPNGTGCIYMMTVPTFTKKRNRTRLRAQKNLEAAFASHGGRCSFVRSYSQQTLSMIEGKARYFRRRKSGRVKDPFHPDKIATRKFLEANKAQLCRAIVAEYQR